METSVICHTIPAEHHVVGNHVKHIRIGKVYKRHDYFFGSHPFVDLVDGGNRVLCMRKYDFELYFNPTLLRPTRYLFLGEKYH